MDLKQASIEKVATEQRVESCVKGNEVLSPRDLAAYLRAADETHTEAIEVLPPDVKRHLFGCPACNENWEFLKKTDPILRASRKKRVELIIRSVASAEAAEKARATAAKDYSATLAEAPPQLSAEQQKKSIEEIEAALSP